MAGSHVTEKPYPKQYHKDTANFVLASGGTRSGNAPRSLTSTTRHLPARLRRNQDGPVDRPAVEEIPPEEP